MIQGSCPPFLIRFFQSTLVTILLKSGLKNDKARKRVLQLFFYIYSRYLIVANILNDIKKFFNQQVRSSNLLSGSRFKGLQITRSLILGLSTSTINHID